MKSKREAFELNAVKGLNIARKAKCHSCIHRRNVGDFGRVQCCHPKVMEIQEMFPERRPGLIAAKALNRMGKELNPRINPAAYEDRWFYWPYCYYPIFIESCSGFEKKHSQ